MKKEKTVLYVFLGILFVVLYRVAWIVLDFYFVPSARAIFDNEGFWMFIHHEIMNMAFVESLSKW